MNKYQEIFKLKALLDERGSKFIFRDWIKGYQIILDNGCDIIECYGSYGSEQDLLEVMGDSLVSIDAGDSVEGHLTAEEVFRRIVESEKVK